MTSLRRLALLSVVLTLAVGGGATAWLTGAGASAVPAAKPAPPEPEPNGVNFTIHTSLDPNFCVEATPSAANPASEATISQCVTRDNQHWTFANAADGSVVIIGGNGDCLTFGAGKLPVPVSVTPCTFKSNERFYYTAVGQIEATSETKCLQPAQAAQDASIYVVKCDPTMRGQVWQLGH